jgi:hypothetical protein
METQGSDTIQLEGTPTEIGTAFGSVNAEDIRSEVEGYLQGDHCKDDLLRSTEEYRGIVERIAPHWVEESSALALAADVKSEIYLAYQGAKYRGINTPECFTYFSPPQHSLSGMTLFHKNRDNKERPQCAYVKGSTFEGGKVYRFAATGDTSDIGTMMGLNEKGLAAAADTGAPDPNPRFIGMMNPDLMRFILEQAASVIEAYEMLMDIHRQGIYAGAKVATNWMFADASGECLRIVQFGDHLDKTHHQSDFLAMREDERGNLVMNTFRESPDPVSPSLMNRLSRTGPVLSETNISAMTAVIPSSKVDLFGYAQFAVYKADRTLYVPIFLGALSTPRILLDGTLYRNSRHKNTDWSPNEVETELDAERLSIESAARSALDNSGTDSARRILTEGCTKMASIALKALKA